jgi:type IV fimbrial biogenesis protein FimT
MTELLAVIVIIGILASAASPMFINLMRDKRVARATLQIADMYRLGRMHALGRGTAVLVRWDAATTLFEVREAVVPGQPLPSSNCFTTNWTAGSNENGLVTDFNLSRDLYSLTQVQMTDPVAATIKGAGGDICFSPRGRSFYRDKGGSFAVMTGPMGFDVTNTRTHFKRQVWVPANGAARAAL